MSIHMLKPTLAAGISAAVGGQLIAEAVPNMPWYGQFGVSSLLGALAWWLVAKTIPEILRTHRESVAEIASKMEAGFDKVQAQIKSDNETANGLLRAQLITMKSNGGS